MIPETGSSGDTEEWSAGEAAPSVQPTEQAVQVPEAGVTPQAGPQVEGKRTQLRIVRENIQSLSSDVGRFRRSHEASAKKLEAQIASLRKELAAHTRSKDLGNHVKSHEARSKLLEKQVVALRNELAALKGHIAKEAARGRAKEEAMLSRILAKVSVKPKPVKSSKKR